jgi:hypothetical protein
MHTDINSLQIDKELGKRRLLLLLCAPLLCLTGGGCGSNGSSSGLLPSDEAGRTAVESALKAWRDGGKPGKLAGTEPPIEVHDTHWAMGERLTSYEILGEDSTAAEKRFSVRLSLSKPAGVQEVQYYVLGKGPILVFRDDDYLRNMNMEDGPKLPRPKPAAARRR